ncbi:MAG: glycosyltransferase family 61 protein [Bacteroidetes bacterium]|jgi:hypothetical protein|nr:glycosyltransferase family 61 protein [Bacteroidota bacterium]
MNGSTSFIIITTKKNKYGNHLESNCGCETNRTRPATLKDLAYILDEIRLNQRWDASVKILTITRLLTVLQLYFKNRPLLTQIIFSRFKYTISNKGDCLQHDFKEFRDKDVWYSRSSSIIGFPISREVFVNSLDMVRMKKWNALVFAPQNDRRNLQIENIRSVEKYIKIGRYKPLSSGRSDICNFEKLGSWMETEFRSYSDAKILHGVIFVKSDTFINQDLTQNFQDAPFWSGPSAVWPNSMMQSGQEEFLTASCKTEIFFKETSLFINANLNFYHFLAESIRPLIYAVENNLEFEHILIRDDLPKQFYQIIEWICPEKSIKFLRFGDTAICETVVMAVMNNRLAATDEIFKEEDRSFLSTDEWKTLEFIRRKISFREETSQILYAERESFESRGIINARKVKLRLGKSGVDVISLNQELFLEQLKKYQSAKLFISTTGAAMTNMIFLREGSSVIELIFNKRISWKFLADACGLQHYKFRLSAVFAGRLQSSIDTYRVKVSKLIQVIQGIMD